MNKSQLQEIKEALFEDSMVLEDVEHALDRKNLPASFRFPLTDELHGFGLLISDYLEALDAN
jgi:hypothetical protein